jgi:hypothetical protein
MSKGLFLCEHARTLSIRIVSARRVALDLRAISSFVVGVNVVYTRAHTLVYRKSTIFFAFSAVACAAAAAGANRSTPRHAPLGTVDDRSKYRRENDERCIGANGRQRYQHIGGPRGGWPRDESARRDALATRLPRGTRATIGAARLRPSICDRRVAIARRYASLVIAVFRSAIAALRADFCSSRAVWRIRKF